MMWDESGLCDISPHAALLAEQWYNAGASVERVS